MWVSQLARVKGNFGYVEGFIRQILDPQFSDVRAMLQLPRPDIGIAPGCNYAIVSSLTNLISGISTTLFKPTGLLPDPPQSQCGSGRAFKELLGEYFPYNPSGTSEFPNDLYQLARNPLAHSAAVMDASSPKVSFVRAFDPSHENVGWSDEELENLENPLTGYSLPFAGIVVEPGHWVLHCDAFYLDVIKMLCRLTADLDQMKAADSRFRAGVYNWRR